jgi:hypothetical protein
MFNTLVRVLDPRDRDDIIQSSYPFIYMSDNFYITCMLASTYSTPAVFLITLKSLILL